MRRWASSWARDATSFSAAGSLLPPRPAPSAMSAHATLLQRGGLASGIAVSERAIQRSNAVAEDVAGAAGPSAEPEPTLVTFSNDEDPNATVIKLCGRNETALLMQLTAVFIGNELTVSSANINTDAQGVVCDIFRVTDAAGGKVRCAVCRWGVVRVW